MATQITQSAPPKADKYQAYIDNQLEKTRARIKVVDLFTGLLAMVVWVLGVLFVLAIIDGWIWTLGNVERGLSLAVLIGGVAVIAARYVLPLFLKKINPKYAARMIEQSRPKFKNSLLNYLWLKSGGQKINQSVTGAMSRRAAEDLSEVTPLETVDQSHLIRTGFILVGLATIAVAYGILSPKNPLPTVARVISPFSDISRPAIVRVVSVTPGDVDIFFGDVVTVEAEIRGRHELEDVQLIFSTDDGQFTDVVTAMQESGNRRYSAELRTSSSGIQQSLQYKVVAKDGESQWYHVDVRPLPAVSVQSLKVIPPEYTQLPERMVEGTGEVESVEGTRVVLNAVTNMPVKTAYIEFLRAKEANSSPDEMKIVKTEDLDFEGQAITGSFLLTLNADRTAPFCTHYRIRYLTPTGDQNSKPNIYPIRVTPDLAPEIEIVEPLSKEISLPVNAPLKIQINAIDFDFEISSVDIHLDNRGSALLDRKVHLVPNGDKHRVQSNYWLVPEKVGLKPGDTAVFFATAADNRHSPYSGLLDPNVARSDSYTITITEPDSQIDEQERDQQIEEEKKQEEKRAQEQQQQDPNQKEQDGDQTDPSEQQDENRGEENPGEEKEDPGTGKSDQDKGENPDKENQDENKGEEKGPDSQNEKGKENASSDADPQEGNDGKKDEQQESDQDSGTGNQQEQNQQESGGGTENKQDSGSGGTGGAQEQPKDASQANGGNSQDGRSQEGTQKGENRQSANDSPSKSDSGSGGNKNASDGSGGAKKPDPENTNGQGERDEDLQDGSAMNENSTDGERFEKLKELLDEMEKEGKSQGTESDERNAENQSDSNDSDSSSDNPGAEGNPEEATDGNPNETDPSDPENQSSTGQKGNEKDPNNKDQDQKNKGGGADQKGEEEKGRSESKEANNQTSRDDNQEESGNKNDPNQQKGGAGNEKDDASSGKDNTKSESQSDSGSDGDPNQDQKSPGENSASGSDSKSGDEKGNSNSKPDSSKSNTSDKPENSNSESGESQSDSNKGGDQNKGNSNNNSESSGNGGGKSGGGGGRPGDMNSEGGDSDEPNERGKTGNASLPNGVGDSEFENAEREKANIEFTKKATDLVLDQLRDQANNPDQRLLDEMNWTAEELRDFLARWEKMQAAAKQGDKASQKLYDSALKSLGLKPGGAEARTVKAERDQKFGLSEDGSVNRPSPDYAERFNSFMKLRNQVERD